MSILTKEGSVLDIAGSSGVSLNIKQLLANIRNDLHKPLNQPRNFRDKKDPKLLKNTCVAVFHGEPHPHQCEDNWVLENWK